MGMPYRSSSQLRGCHRATGHAGCSVHGRMPRELPGPEPARSEPAAPVPGQRARVRAASQDLDKAASKGVIHKNQAANRKSAMAQRCAELSES